MRNTYFRSGGVTKILRRTFLTLVFATLLSSIAQSTTLVDPNGDGGFQNGSTFAANGWTLANSTGANQWVIGTSTTTGMSAPFTGNRAYTSNDAGVSNGYNNASISVNYFWRDITIPAGESILNYSFTWVSSGESTWDMIQLFTAPTSLTPTATTTYPGSGLSTTNLVGATFINAYNLQTTVQSASGTITVTPGTSIRIIFCWKNDGSGGTLPAGSLDNISFVSSPPVTYTATSMGGLWSSPATWVGGVVPGANNDISIPAGSSASHNPAWR